jgi:NADH dehydrogenase/NADH:ubiquinone oxidoreductase subunit G
LNLRLRQMGVTKTSTSHFGTNSSASAATNIGCPLNLTYPNEHEGAQMNTLYLLAQGKTTLAKNLIRANEPTSLVGISTTQRKDGYVSATRCLLNQAFEYWTKVKFGAGFSAGESRRRGAEVHSVVSATAEAAEAASDKSQRRAHLYSIAESKAKQQKSRHGAWSNPINRRQDAQPANRINILHAHASTPGALDLGLANRPLGESRRPSNRRRTRSDFLTESKNQASLIYCLNGGLEGPTQVEGGPFIIYQGHHGVGIEEKQANGIVILPSTTFVEKKGTYVNTEGRVQRCLPVPTSTSAAQHDWKIIQNLASLPFFGAAVARTPIGGAEQSTESKRSNEADLWTHRIISSKGMSGISAKNSAAASQPGQKAKPRAAGGFAAKSEAGTKQLHLQAILSQLLMGHFSILWDHHPKTKAKQVDLNGTLKQW